MKEVRAKRGGHGEAMRGRSVSRIPFVLLGVTALGMGCQLLYDKNDLTVSTGGAGGTTSSTSGGTGGTTSTTGGGGTTSSGGSTGGSTSSGGSTGGTTTGGTGGTTTTGGTGGTTTTGGTGGVTTTTTTTTLCPDPLMLVATSAAKVACATYKNEGPWVATSYANAGSTLRPSASMTDGSTGIGAFYQPSGMTGPVRVVTVSNGGCAGVSNADAATTKAAPTTTTQGGAVKMLFRGVSGGGQDRPILWSWTLAGGWVEVLSPIPNVLLPTVNAIAPNGTALAANGDEMLMAHGGYDVDKLFSGRFNGAAWQAEVDLALPTNRTLRPALAPLGPGNWLLVAFPTSGGTLKWGVVDGVPSFVDIAGSNAADDTLSLTATSTGAVLAYKSAANADVVTMAFDAAGNTWSALPVIPGAPKTSAAPALARGLCAHTAELVYIDSADGLLKHTFLEAGAWHAPAPVDDALTSMTNVSIAGLP